MELFECFCKCVWLQRGPTAPEGQELFCHLLVCGGQQRAVQTCRGVDRGALAAALETSFLPRCVPWPRVTPNIPSPPSRGYSHP